MSKTEKNALDLLKGAYNLITPDDNKKYYEGFAPFYDSVFVKDEKCCHMIYNVVVSSDADYKEVYIETTRE